MRASELIGCQVYDADGHDAGSVHDLHFRMQQRPDGSRVCQLDALECGGIGFGHRLGYGEHAMRGPWPFPQLFRYLVRRSLVVPWTEITAIDGRRIDISCRRDQLQPAQKHHVADVLCMELASMPTDAERFDAKATVLIENVMHHIEEEEQDWFPKVRAGLGRKQLQELGAKLQQAREKAPRSPAQPSALKKTIDAVVT